MIKSTLKSIRKIPHFGFKRENINTTSTKPLEVEVEEIFDDELSHESIMASTRQALSSEEEKIANSLNISAIDNLGLQQDIESEFGAHVVNAARHIITHDYSIDVEDGFISQTVEDGEFDVEDVPVTQSVFESDVEDVSVESAIQPLFNDTDNHQNTFHSKSDKKPWDHSNKDQNFNLVIKESSSIGLFSLTNLDFDLYRSLFSTFEDYNGGREVDSAGTDLVALPMTTDIIFFPRSLVSMQPKFIDEVKKSIAIYKGSDIHQLQTQLIDDAVFVAYAKDTFSENIKRRSADINNQSAQEDTATIKEMLCDFLSTAVQNNCTDMHFYLREQFVVKFRSKGLIQEYLTITDDYSVGRSLFNSIINDLGAKRGSGSMNYVEFEGTGFAMTAYTDKQKREPVSVELRIEKAPIDGGMRDEAAGLYIRLSKDQVPQTLTQLRIEPHRIKILKRAMAQPQGMILVTGPTGSGKTTLLHAILREMSPGLAARTIEDPVELRASYNDNIAQMSVSKHQWPDALESALRQDPNVIMIGEIRSKEMLETLTQATLTGHLTLTTLHTNGAIATLTRMIDIGGKPQDLASEQLLSLIIATRLNNVPCKSCALKFDSLDHHQQEIVLEFLGDDRDKVNNLIFTNKQSSSCTCKSGQLGMISTQEIIYVNDSIRSFIRTQDWVGMKSYLEDHGWKDFQAQARDKIINGELDFFEVQNVIRLSLQEDENAFRYED